MIREEGGTPDIIGSIRAGLVFALKEEVGAEEICRREQDFARRALRSWGANRKIEILGSTTVERLPIVTFGLRHPPQLLHSAFVVTLLSDLFGIQARSGCFCAGPYIHRMYSIDDDWSAQMHAECSAGHLGVKLAFARVGFNYFRRIPCSSGSRMRVGSSAPSRSVHRAKPRPTRSSPRDSSESAGSRSRARRPRLAPARPA